MLDEISNIHKDISIIISNAGATRDNLYSEWCSINGLKLFRPI